MFSNKLICLLFTSLINFMLAAPAKAQKEDLSQVWPAKWIMPQNAPAKAYSVHHFRRTFFLDSLPSALVVHSSGDMRYQFFVNGRQVCWGPLRGDLRHWYYESTDIAPYLVEGRNVLAVLVLNYGAHPPDAQLSVQTGFVLAADDRNFRFLNSGREWKAMHNRAYSPNKVDREQVAGYYGGGSREQVDGRLYPWGWQDPSYDDSAWMPAELIENAYAKSCKWASRWKLTARELPHERLGPERFESVRLPDGIEIPPPFPQKPEGFTIPAFSRGSFVLDRGHLTTAYPVLSISGGRDSKIRFTYVEAPYVGKPSDKEKGNRGEVEGKNFIGYSDIFISDGGQSREYKALWWRAFRYIKVDFETAEEPLVIRDISAIRSTYPFEQKARLRLGGEGVDPALVEEILKTGHRTLMACSHEHYMDCPYYEESQFEGDTRIEILASYMNYGDPSLARNAIGQFAWSVNDEGFLSARYPTNSLYYIPNFSLYWIGMLYDYLMFAGEKEFVASHLPVARHILNYFHRHERRDGTLAGLDYHLFVDWSFPAGEAPRDEEDYSAVADLHYLMALQWAAQLEAAVGSLHYRELYEKKAAMLSEAIRKIYRAPDSGLYCDIPGDTTRLSQHSNCLAILTGLSRGEEAVELMQKVLEGRNMVRATLYWHFYVFEALEKSGLGHHYLEHLDPWEEVLELGVTTWPETGPNSRSECHGWGASPNYHFYKLLGGISPAAPGFASVRIAPRLGQVEKLDLEIPHPRGLIAMSCERNGESLEALVELPPGISGVFFWKGQEKNLRPGSQRIRF